MSQRPRLVSNYTSSTYSDLYKYISDTLGSTNITATNNISRALNKFIISGRSGQELLTIDQEGNLLIHGEISEAVIALKREWRKHITTPTVKQIDVDALAYLAGIFIEEPKKIYTLREAAFDRLESLVLDGFVELNEGCNPVLI